jgi:hypothetical protein
MKSPENMRPYVVAVLLLVWSVFNAQLIAQNSDERKFHFGISAGVIAAQIDGDALNGFHKAGYQFGLLGGYSMSKAHWLVVELQYAQYGSRKKNEDVEENLEATLSSLNVLLGYSLRFGDSWDGVKKFRFIVGPKFHRIINVDGSNITKEALKSQFIAAHVGFSYIISRSVILDLTYTYSVVNLLIEPLRTTDTYVPYYLTLGVSYYIRK